jgi:chromosome segregation ATPase
MQREDYIKDLKKENEELQFQLKDLEYLIQLKEEELADLKKASQHVAELQSKIDQNLYQFEQMQLYISEEQHKLQGALKREASMEQELIDVISIEKSYYEIKEEFNSTKTALHDITEQMNEAASIYQQCISLKKKVTELESNLEIVNLDNQFLKEELSQNKKSNS